MWATGLALVGRQVGRTVFPEMLILEYKTCILAVNQVFISRSSPLVSREAGLAEVVAWL